MLHYNFISSAVMILYKRATKALQRNVTVNVSKSGPKTRVMIVSSIHHKSCKFYGGKQLLLCYLTFSLPHCLDCSQFSHY